MDELRNQIQEEVNLLYMYNEFYGIIVKNEMLQTLPNRHVSLKFGLDNKLRIHRKPWWNDSFAGKWSQVC